jgi:phage shock protein A
MTELLDIIGSLENKISKLVHTMEVLELSKERLQTELNQAKESNKKLESDVVAWEEKYNSLKMANSMLGSNADKTEAKLKINTLIRELDHCIAQLSE